MSRPETRWNVAVPHHKRRRAAQLLRITPARVRVVRDADGTFRIGSKWPEEHGSAAAKAAGIAYPFDPRYAIGTGKSVLNALLDLARRVERGRWEAQP